MHRRSLLSLAFIRFGHRGCTGRQRSTSFVSKVDGDGAGDQGLRLYLNGADAEESQPPLVTIIWCHGLGDTAYGWMSAFGPQGQGITAPGPFKVVLPTAPMLPVTINGGMVMPSWYDIYGLDRHAKCDSEGIAKSVARLSSLIKREQHPVVLGGFSQGGAIALSVALGCPELHNVIGVVAASSYLPLLDEYRVPPTHRIPYLICHGDCDEVINVEYGQATHDKLSGDLGLDCDFRVFQGLGHAARQDELDVISDFLATSLASSRSIGSS